MMRQIAQCKAMLDESVFKISKIPTPPLRPLSSVSDENIWVLFSFLDEDKLLRNDSLSSALLVREN